MTSHAQKNKDEQGYRRDPQKCSNCQHYRSDVVEMPADEWQGAHTVEKNKRCYVGGFAVQLSGSCSIYSARENETK